MNSSIIIPQSWDDLSQRLEYSNLRSDAREADIRLLCLEAEKMGIAVILVNPVNVRLAADILRGTKVKVAAAVSYPVGGDCPDFKEKEVGEAVEDGAEVIYMLMAVGAFRDNWVEQQTLPEIRGLVKSAAGRATRLMTEASVLNKEQKKMLCDISSTEGVKALVVNSGFSRSRLPELKDNDIKEFVGYAQNKLEIFVTDMFGTLDGVSHYYSLGVNQVCTEYARAYWQKLTIRNQ
jgi:deoxyribose-phosphate aldolase